MKNLGLTIVLGMLLLGVSPQAVLASQPPSTGDVLKQAMTQAKSSKRNVWVIFHASWCGWCKKLDAFIDSPEFKPIFDRNFVIVHLTVMENGDKKNLENPGGMEYMTKLGGAAAGLPFFAMLDSNGKVLSDSMMVVPGKTEKQNTGHPMAPEEVAHFMTMLQKAAPNLSQGDRDKINKFLSSQKR